MAYRERQKVKTYQILPVAGVIGLAVGALFIAPVTASATTAARATTAGAATATLRTSAAPAGVVTFIGDSVTAGFGYCGIAENAKNVSCSPNQEMADSWYFGNNSLSGIAEPDAPAPLNDACSNDNDKGMPWNAPAWTRGPHSPRIAYPYQIAESQSATSSAAVSDWAITGSTPANWDPKDGVYGPHLKKLKNQYVVLTLGANPLLAAYTNIVFKVPYVPNVRGRCVGSTGYKSGADWYSGPISATVDCLNADWDRLDQTQHLVDIYKALLSQNDHVLVVGYYRACSWSFGNWQPDANLFSGPAKGHGCGGETRWLSPKDHTQVSQWEQAVAVGDSLNEHIFNAITQARDWAKTEWPGTDRYTDLAWTLPDQSAWAAHQALSSDGSWILLNDTWIHPNRVGAAQLAKTVTEGMCAMFHHWCGSTPAWG
jgi:hypothetical protein